ncbi:glycoside hydrolase family 97 protein, partial [bacterium]
SAAAKAQMATAYPEYERMGIEGVMVDFFDRDDQDTVNLVREVVALSAKCHLTVTLHNVYKPTGLERTYPNLLSTEAARNLEFDKWDPVGVLPEQELIVPFVRMLAGPIDYHSGSFRNVARGDFKPVDKAPMTIGTRARQLARYVVYEGALPMIADSPAVYEASPSGLSFLVEVPTTWDETRFLAGEVGRYVVLARRKGRDWYLGAMNDESPRVVKVPLLFLGNGRYRTERWADGASPTEMAISRGEARRSETLNLDLAASGGMAVRFRPER